MAGIVAVLLAVALATAINAGSLDRAEQDANRAEALPEPTRTKPEALPELTRMKPIPASTPSSTTTAAPAVLRKSCSTARGAFTPRAVSIAGVTKRASIVTPPRVGPGLRVPGAPPLTRAGKELVAWDEPSGIRPGERAGNVRLNAHSWPDGSALGNRMIRSLRMGDQIVVYGTHSRLCYRVTERLEVPASRGLPRYYGTNGRPQLAIVTCSGRRVGPGEWTMRTVWFATPI